MSKIVYIAEKPSVAAALADYIGISHKTKHFYKCKDGETYVTWLLGHVLELVDAQDYDPKYAKWVLSDLPILPKEFKLRPAADKISGGKVLVDNEYKRVQLDALAKLISDADEVCLATDPDIEGELLGVEAIEYLKWDGNLTRILPTSLDDDTLKQCIDAKKPASATRKFYEAGLARSQIDWSVGINVTRGLTTYNRDKVNNPLHSGRVQTFIVGELYNNEVLRKEFKAKPTYNVEAKANVDDQSINFKFVPPADIKQILNHNDDNYDPVKAAEVVSSLSAELNGKDGEITKSEKKRKNTAPKLGYRLSDLQIECTKKFGMSAAETLETCQSMYEAKIVSYPRTDCQYMPEMQHEWAPKIVNNLQNGIEDLPALEGLDLTRKTKAWNSKKIENHHAIIPTQKAVNINSLKPRQQDVYRLIAHRYLMQFMPDYEYDNVDMELTVGDKLFKSTGNTPVLTGWKVLEGKTEASDEDDNQFLPQIDLGTVAKNVQVIKKESKTTKPKPYTEDKILTLLMNAHKLVKDKVLADNMKKREAGIGTQATAGNILAEMKKKGFYTVEKKKFFELTDKGRMTAQIAPKELIDAGMTADLEYKFHLIEKGEINYKEVLSSYNDMIIRIIDDIKAGKCELPQTLVKSFPCKCCDGEVVQKYSKKSKKKFWVCIKCSAFFKDHYGKPAEQIQTEREECPSCEKKSLIRYESKKVKGFFSWFCTDEACKKSFPDKDGKVDPKVRSCPKCKKSLSLIISAKNKRKYWICPDREGCNNILPDLNGEPNYDFVPPKVSEHKCLSCGGALISRNGSKGAFWGCANWNKKGVECRHTYQDNNGEPILELKEIHKCPSCGGTLAQRNGSKGAFWGCNNWNKKGVNCKSTYEDVNGKPKLDKK